MTIPTDEQVIEELKRELRVRLRHFPRWIDRGDLDAEVAAHRIACIERAIAIIEDDGDLFSAVTEQK